MIGSAVRVRTANKRLSVYDDFNRADSASLGTTPSGQLWTAGASFSIVSNTLREAGTNGETAQVLFNKPDQLVVFTVGDLTKSGVSAFARLTSSGYYFAVSDSSGTYRLLKFINPSTFTTLFTGSGLALGDRLGIYCKGSYIALLKNRVVVYSETADPALLLSTSVGFRSSSASSPKIFDDFKVYAL